MRRYLVSLVFAIGILALALNVGQSVAQKSEKKKTGPVIKVGGKKETQESQTYDFYKAGKADAPNLYVFNLPKTLKADEKETCELTVQQVTEKKEDLIAAWKKLFLPPTGYTIDEVTRVTDLKAASGAPITVVFIRGSYTPESSKKLDGYLMLCALLETKDGNFQFRLVGPQTAVSPHQSDFYDILKAFKVSQ